MIVGQASPTIWTPACVVCGEVSGAKGGRREREIAYGYVERGGDDVHALVDINNLTPRKLIKHSLQRGRIVRLSIALNNTKSRYHSSSSEVAPARALLVTTYLGALRLYRHELGRREIRVCRSSLSEYLAAAGQEHRRFIDRGDRALMERPRGVRARVDIPARIRIENSVNKRSHKNSRARTPEPKY